MKPTKMYLYYYFDMHEFIYVVRKTEIFAKFGEEPDDEKDRDEWYDKIEEYYFDAARDEAKRVSDENESALEALKDDYMRSV